MNKAELVEAVAQNLSITKKDAGANVDAVLDAITATLVAGDKVQLMGFGTFEVRERAARKARNPQTGEEIKIKFDDLSEAEADLVKIVGREYVALEVVSPNAFVKINKQA